MSLDMLMINTALQSVADAGTLMASNLLGTGTALAGVLGAVVLAWNVLLWMLESPVEEIFGGLVRLLMKGTIVTWILLGYVNTLAGLNVKQMFTDSMNGITAMAVMPF